MIAVTPAPPYYAVVFSSVRRVARTDGGGVAGAKVAGSAETTAFTAVAGVAAATRGEGGIDGAEDTGRGDDGYEAMAQRMLALAARQPGFLGVESARDGLGITVSYWQTLEAIRDWKRQVDHQEAQRRGRADWYLAYRTRICRVEREYGFDADTDVGVDAGAGRDVGGNHLPRT